MDCSPPGSSVHGILQARILEWVAIGIYRSDFWLLVWVMFKIHWTGIFLEKRKGFFCNIRGLDETKYTFANWTSVAIHSVSVPLGFRTCCACVPGYFSVSDSLGPHGLWPARLLCPWDIPGKNTGVGCHSLLQGIFPTHGSNSSLLSLLYCKRILYPWATREAINLLGLP